MDAGAVEELIGQNRVVARAQARLLELVLRVTDAAEDPRYGADEVAFALTWTRATADVQEDLARQLICGLPEVFAAFCRGDIDLPKARVFADTLQALDRGVASKVAAQVLAVAPQKTTAQLRAMLHRRALAADPAHAHNRREQGVRERRVIVEPAADGTARLTALGLAPDRAQAAFERVTAMAKARKLSGAVGTMDQLRADALLDLLDGTQIDALPGPRRGVVELIVCLETLAGLDENPGALNGFGPVAADIARQCAAAHLNAQWRFSVIDRETGQLLFHTTTRARPEPPRATSTPPQASTRPAQTGPASSPSRARARPAPPRAASTSPAQTGPVPCPPPQDPEARFPNAAMAAWIRARDRTCRAPGCRKPARACHLDHTIDFARGGRTTHDDLGAVCEHHHGMKHKGGWQLYQIRPGHFIWISPANRIYHVGPEPP